MRYLGGKYRQSKQIVTAIEEIFPDFEEYVEPFCGAMGAGSAVMRHFPGRRYYFSDCNANLIITWQAMMDGWDPPERITEKEYRWWKEHQPDGDPMTAYVGFSFSFAGMYYASPARQKNGEMYPCGIKNMTNKIEALRANKDNVVLYHSDFRDAFVPDDAMVYLDPPYVGNTSKGKPRAARGTDVGFDDEEYEEWARCLARDATVIATDFEERDGWAIVHDFGDTVALRRGESDGTRELIMIVLEDR